MLMDYAFHEKSILKQPKDQTMDPTNKVSQIFPSFDI